MDNLFHVVEDGVVILRCKGRFFQCSVYHRSGHIYAKCGAGYVQLLAKGYTTQPNTSWEEGVLMSRVFYPRVGPPVYEPVYTGPEVTTKSLTREETAHA